MDTPYKKNVDSIDITKVKRLSNDFRDWYSFCKSQNYQVGPINKVILGLWLEINNINISTQEIDYIVNDNL